MVQAPFLVFPDQLFKSLFTLPKSTPFCFIEDARFFNDRPYHKHILIFRRASMQSVRERLLVKGYTVDYFDASQSLGEVMKVMQEKGILELHHYAFLNHDVEKEVTSLAKKHGFTLVSHATPALLNLDKSKNFDKFYENARKKLNVLIKNDKPVGDVWQLSARLPKTRLPQDVPLVHVPEHSRYIDEAMHYVDTHFNKNQGTTEHFVFPVTYADAEDWLEDFVLHRLPHYDEYENIMMHDEAVIFHAALDQFLNSGLLTPLQVVEMLKSQQHPEPVEHFFRHLAAREYAWLELGGKNVQPSAQKPLPKPLGPIPVIVQRIQLLAFCQPFEKSLLLQWLRLSHVSDHDIHDFFMTFTIDATPWLTSLFINHDKIMTSQELLQHSDLNPGPWTTAWDNLIKIKN